jgi:hypothetical protein
MLLLLVLRCEIYPSIYAEPCSVLYVYVYRLLWRTGDQLDTVVQEERAAGTNFHPHRCSICWVTSHKKNGMHVR